MHKEISFQIFNIISFMSFVLYNNDNVQVLQMVLFTYLGKEDLSLSRYSPRAFWIFPRRSASRSRDLCTPCMFSTSITNGDFDTFFISAKNSVLILKNKDSKANLGRLQ